MKSLAPLYATTPLPLHIAQQQIFIFIFEFIFTFILTSISILMQQPSSPYCAVGTSISIHIYIVLQQIYITFMQQPSSPYCAVDVSVSIHILLCCSIGYSYLNLNQYFYIFVFTSKFIFLRQPPSPYCAADMATKTSTLQKLRVVKCRGYCLKKFSKRGKK